MRQAQPEILGLALGMICVIGGVALAVVLVIAICYLLTLQKALSRVSPRNRLMEPGMVWLSLIPFFHLIWAFFIATRVPDSLRNEFRERRISGRGRDDGSDYGRSIGLTMAILNIVTTVVSYGRLAIPSQEIQATAVCVSGLISLIGLALFVMFWVKIAGYSSQLGADDRGDLDWRLEKFDDDDDDRGAPPGDSPKPSPDTYKEGDPGRYQ